MISPLRRHPLLWTAGLLLAAAGCWIVYFLATFNLDHYRDQIAQELSRQLQTPVRLGEAHVELRDGGVAFRFADLQVGTAQAPAELQARRLWLQLAWYGLLLGRPIFTEVALDAPRLRLALPLPAADAPSAKRFGLEKLGSLRIRNVKIEQGTLDISWFDGSGAERSLSVADIAVEVTDFGVQRTIVFDAAGRMPGAEEPARLTAKGSIDLSATGNLREALLDLEVKAEALDAGRLSGLLPGDVGFRAAGKGDLALSAKGTAAAGISFQAELAGTQLHVHHERLYDRPLPVRQLQAAGTWQRLGENHHLRQLTLQLDGLRLAGEATVAAATDGHRIEGTLSNCTLPLDTLRYWIPRSMQQGVLLERLRPSGLLLLHSAAFHATLPATAATPAAFSLDRLEGEVQQLTWAIGTERTAELSALTLSLDGGQWRLRQGSGTIAGLPLTLSGTVTPQVTAPAQLALDLEASGTAAQLVALWPSPLPPDLAIAGSLKIAAHLTGTIDQPVVAARADLALLDVRYGERLHLPPTAGAELTVQGQGNRTTFTVSQAELAVPPLRGSLTGAIDWTGGPTIDLAGRLELSDLTAAYGFIPVLDKFKPLGGAAVDFAASGPAASPQVRTSLELRDVAVPAHGVVADISRLNGRLVLNGKELRSERLTARLGKSPVILQARVADLESPRLELGVKAAAVRANELIFHSDRAMLHDLSGQLLIDRDGIDFMPVQVRLAGGTRATVRGTVRNFAAPQVALEISGEYAKIDEIIGLWTNQSDAARAARRARPSAGGFPTIRIKATARQGELYGMKFRNATAVIVPTAGRLLIHPLDFGIGEGYCTAQVLVDFSASAPLLRISGHAENVDAYQVYNELLDRKSIMRGALRGDFYLQGELGKVGFLPTTFGNFNVAVSDGIMRHSPVLATIFSLLNVSQLFALELPDVSLEGVPFSRLTAEARIDKGVLRSEDLVIDSDAMSMSYVGQYDMVRDDLDLLIVVKPLGTIDKVVSSLPIAGWILGGEERALITAQFRVTGPAGEPDVEAIPISAMSKGVLGIFQRTLSLPLKLIDDPAILWGGGGEKKD